MLRSSRIFLWRLCALIGVALGVIGLALPVMPTVPFLIFAAWAASKSSPELERRLVEHPYYGPQIRAWREHGAVPRRAKWYATIGMTGSAVLIQFMPIPQWTQLGVPLVMLCVAVWLWLRPDC